MLPWLFVLLAFPAGAVEITSFEPSEVTLGTNVRIFGNFTDLVVDFDVFFPKVVGTRPGSTQRVTFDVLSWQPSVLDVRVKKIPSSSADPAAGKTWNLVVVPPKGFGAPVQAPGVFTSVPPTLVSLAISSGLPGQALELVVDDAGTGKLTVLFDTKKAKLDEGPPLSVHRSQASTRPLSDLGAEQGRARPGSHGLHDPRAALARFASHEHLVAGELFARELGGARREAGLREQAQPGRAREEALDVAVVLDDARAVGLAQQVGVVRERSSRSGLGPRSTRGSGGRGRPRRRAAVVGGGTNVSRTWSGAKSATPPGLQWTKAVSRARARSASLVM